MPAAYVGAAAAAGSLALNISNSGGSNVPMPYQPGNQGFQDQSFNNLTSLMNNYAMSLPQQLIPQFQQTQQNISNNPYAMLAQQGANQAGAMAPGVAGMQFGGAGQLYGAGSQVMNTAFDPQQALYNRTTQQIMDQINAANAASGVSGPAAAGLAQQGLTNWNIDWQNNLLNRERMGIQAGSQAFGGASDLGGLGMQTLQAGSNAPYSTYLGQQQNIFSGLNSLNAGVLGSFGLPQQQIQDIESYLGLGQSANALAQSAQQQAFNQNRLAGQDFANAFAPGGPASTLQSGINSLFAPSPAYQGYNSQYGTNFTGSANDNFGYSGFDFAQAG